MKDSIITDSSGVNTTIQYIFTFVTASILFTFVLLISNGMFVDNPQKSASAVQFTDIGNDLATKMVDTYLIAPQAGYVNTTFDMPFTVAGKPYMAGVTGSGQDKNVTVYSSDNGVSISVTLNGFNSTIPVSGNTTSGAATHRIRYQK